MSNIYVTIHCHFYQPPRENPWLNAIEKEDSAFPFHDWNERVTFECYRPNAYGRVLDAQGKILDVINNYSFLNFNFGPTLFCWLEKNAPLIYKRVIEADKESIKRFGSGNAIAQIYHHIIMPLADELDKETEIIWGISDFKKRFNRKPESIWLPETAIDYQTLALLVKYGFQYIILSPSQALKIKPLGSKIWIDVSSGEIDTSQPYRCYVKDKSGRKFLDQFIDIFFYNGLLSKEIAFGDLLSNGEEFCERFKNLYQESKKRPQLIHVAMDGETYGHHKKFGDLALAYAIKKGFSSRGLELINYSSFLKKFPPIYEVEIYEGPKGEGSSWSCAHGIGRWKEDCGCFTGGHEGWNQEWRGPLRESLNLLRNELFSIYMNEGEKIFKDPILARNYYIDFLLDRSTDRIEKFFIEHGRPGLNEKKRIRGIKLLEMQRHALGMFTSCGWFFSDISGLESQIILRYAAKAIELAEELTAQKIENRFLDNLSYAKSNIADMRDGKYIYQRFVKSRSVSIEALVNQYAISSFFEKDKNDRKLFSFFIKKLNYEVLTKGFSILILGRVRVTHDIIPEKKEFIFGLINSKKNVFRTWVSEEKRLINFDKLKEKVSEIGKKREEEIEDEIKKLIGGKSFGLSDIVSEFKEEIFKKIFEKNLDEFRKVFEELFIKMEGTIQILTEENVKIPYEIQMISEFVLSYRLLNLLMNMKDKICELKEGNEIDRIVETARRSRFNLMVDEFEAILSKVLKERIGRIREEMSRYVGNENNVKRLINDTIEFLKKMEIFGFRIKREEAQDIMSEILKEYVYEFEFGLWRGGIKKPFPMNIYQLAEKLDFNIKDFPMEGLD